MVCCVANMNLSQLLITTMGVIPPVGIGLPPSQKRNSRRNRLRPERACENLAMQQPYEHRTPTHYDAWGGGEWTVDEKWECKCHDTVHSVSVTYVRNPRDVDLLSWLSDGKYMGYKMF